ncbi:GNAT family N-acetyltransferase [Spiroplasma diminutum]|uniref:Acetyltransferase, GNAT family protein n=1 Tax=Spiroplasma diminutum CUAS-1 TaxID=1276221 RepID=S5MDS9_9MOLU|nr:GNAT family N-acetyltransferase [Spiroplasma diminutum]AGR41873.1 acetyltransferase, GNAT family protein [Spiroplasma diminutum CUAS-1]
MEFLIDFSMNNVVFEKAKDIRIDVFCNEQNYSQEEEIDAYDEKSYHVIGFFEQKPVCCARIVNKPDGTYLGRIAVLKEYRGKGLGSKLVDYLVKYVTNNLKITEIFLESQDKAVKLYEKFGFKIISEPFMDGPIVHYKMVRN